MAEINPVVGLEGPGRCFRVTWTGLANGDTGTPVSFPGAADVTVQVLGTFGTGGTVNLQGCLQQTPVDYFSLKDPQGNAMTYTSSDAEMVSQVTAHMRPNITAGDGSTDLTIIALFRSTM